MTNSEKLRALADWFDGYDFSSKGFLNHNEVQQDLRAMAKEFEQLNKHVVMQGLQEKTIQLSKAVLDHINSKLQGYIEPSPSLNSVGVLAFDILHKLSSSPTVGKAGEDASVSDGK